MYNQNAKMEKGKTKPAVSEVNRYPWVMHGCSMNMTERGWIAISSVRTLWLLYRHILPDMAKIAII